MANVNPIPTYTDVEVDNNGVLACAVRQPCDGTPSMQGEKYTYVERWKTAYANAKSLGTYLKSLQTISQVRSHLEDRCGNLVEDITYPTCPPYGTKTRSWRLEGFRVNEIDAGAHCVVELSFAAYLDEEEGGDGQYDDWQDYWTVTWQPYSVDPYAFCSNIPHKKIVCSPSFTGQGDLPDGELMWSSAVRSNIDKYMSSLPNSATDGEKTAYYYTPDPASPYDREFLTYLEAAILEKKQLGRSATYHYPVITHSMTKTGQLSALSGYSETIGGSIDHETPISSFGLSGQCPYKFTDEWHFIKVGDEMTLTKDKRHSTNSFTHKEIWWGMKDYDVNFYGNGQFSPDKDGVLSGRWPIGGM